MTRVTMRVTGRQTGRRRAPRRAAGPAAVDLAVTDRGRPRTKPSFLRRVVAAALAFAGRPELRVSLLLTDDRGIARVHAAFLGDARPTDVISFDVDGTAEIVVSVTTAARVAAALGHSRAAEIALYVVHGILHLCGYDDVHARARARMRRAEREVLDALALRVADVDIDADVDVRARAVRDKPSLRRAHQVRYAARPSR
jgi:probable rRNA maturation factor